MIFKDYYKIIGLETNKVTLDNIKLAYREQVKKYHPDLNSKKEEYEERFKDINEAYNILSDVAARRKYDRAWHTYVGKKKNSKDNKTGESVTKELKNIFFGNVKDIVSSNPVKEKVKQKSKEPVKGDNIETEIKITIAEAFSGIDKKISLRTTDGGMKAFSIKIPAGIRDKEKIRLIAQGKEGKNGGKPGDMFIKVKIADNQKYKLDGYNIVTDILLTPWEAALGTKVNVNSIDDVVSAYIPSGIQSGDAIKITGRGYKDGKGGRGDLVLVIKILVPKELTKDEEYLFTKLKEISDYNPRSLKKQ